MADEWIKMRMNLRRHPKVARMASALRADRLRVVGGLHAAWSVFDEQSEDGVLEGYTPETLDEEVVWPGFTAAMIAVGWAEYDGKTLVLPRFDTHNGQSAKRRAQETERKRRARVSASDADKKRTRSARESGPEGEGEREDLSLTGEIPTHPTPAPAPSPMRVVGGALTPAGEAAIALRKAGVNTTSQNPDLLEYLREGGTTTHLIEVAQAYPGKPVKYLCTVARRELAERAAAIDTTPATPRRPAAPSRQRQAIEHLMDTGATHDDDTHPEEPARLVHGDHR